MSNGRDRFEFGAVAIVVVLLGLLGIAFWAATEGFWVWMAVGLVAAIALLVATIVMMRRPHRRQTPSAPSLPDGAARRVRDGTRRILVIADAACAPADLGAAVVRDTDVRGVSVFVIAPALGSRAARWTGDEHAYEEATDRLAATLAALRELEVDADGHVGSHDPLQAADDGLREFPADEIAFAVCPSVDPNWLERGVVDDARARYPLTVRELTVERS